MKISNSNPISLAETGGRLKGEPLTRPAALGFNLVAAVEDERDQ